MAGTTTQARNKYARIRFRGSYFRAYPTIKTPCPNVIFIARLASRTMERVVFGLRTETARYDRGIEQCEQTAGRISENERHWGRVYFCTRRHRCRAKSQARARSSFLFLAVREKGKVNRRCSFLRLPRV